VLYVRGSNYTGVVTTTGITKLDATTNTSLGSSANFNGSGEDMVLSQDGSKLYLVLFGNIQVLNTSDLSLITTISYTPFNYESRAILNPSGTKLYVGGANTLRVINTSDYTITTTISDPKLSLSYINYLNPCFYIPNIYNQKVMVFSPDGSKLYLAGGKFIDTATDTLNAQDLLGGVNSQGSSLIINKDGTKLYTSGGIIDQPDTVNKCLGYATKVIDIKTGQLDKLLPNGIKFLSPDGSKLYIIRDEGFGLTVSPNRTKIYVFETRTNTQIAVSDYLPDTVENAIISKDGSSIYTSGYRRSVSVGGSISVGYSSIVDTNSLTYSNSIDQNIIASSIPRSLSNNGKSIFYSNGSNVNIQNTNLLTTADISSFDCTSPTNTLGSTVTCTVNSNTTKYGLAKFNVGLETCTAYLPATGGNSASCTYTANNIQSSTITITPSYGAASTSSNSLTITGGADDVTIAASNITTNNNCTVTGNLKINTVLDCDLTLTGSNSNTYILPSQGIKVEISTVNGKSDFCTINLNGTTNAKLSCKNIPSSGGIAGVQNIQAFINNSSTPSNIGSINLTDGFLVPPQQQPYHN